MLILGISAFFHDSAACLLQDGKIIAAAQEERFTRIKHDSSFPICAIKYCLQAAQVSFDKIEYVGFYEKPHLKFERIVRNYANAFPKGFDTFKLAVPSWLKEKLWLPGFIRSNLFELSESNGRSMKWDGKVLYSEHHFAHAASAFYPSPFQEAAVVTLDGVGEWATTTLAHGEMDSRGVPQINFLNQLDYPDSLGMLYSTFTAYLGFKVNSGEYKVMGLAPYGEPKYVQLILNNLIDVKADGSFHLNMEYFSFPYSQIMFTDAFNDLFDQAYRSPETLLEQRHFDIAASLQSVTTFVVHKIVTYLHQVTGCNQLCMAGGVALNCVANGELLRNGPYRDIWVQPAAGDAGGALGVALFIWHEVLGQRRVSLLGQADLMEGSYLGPSFSNEEIKGILDRKHIPYHEIGEEELPIVVAQQLAQEKIVGWFQGRMEFGPRALGGRSILGDARSPKTQRIMNLKIKFRESFRPFAPSVLREKVHEWFDLNGQNGSDLGDLNRGYDSPYMLLVAPVKDNHCIDMTEDERVMFGIEKLNIARSTIPACTHVDYSARIQTVTEQTNPLYYRLIKAFENLTGVPVIVNTSFNVRGEPIVCSPEDAVNCFLGTEMDILALGGFLILKDDIPDDMKIDYKEKFELD